MHPADHIAARFALQRGWVSTETLSACLQDVQDGRDPALVTVLLERGLVSGIQKRELELEQARQMRLVEKFEEIQRADGALGRHLLEEGIVESNRLDEAVYLQRGDLSRGHVRRLGDLLVSRGAMTREALKGALERRGVRRLECAVCGKGGPLASLTTGELMTCGSCGGPMAEEGTLTSLRRDPQRRPEEVQIAERMPDRDCGKFILIQHLGTGGMGAVWKAWDRELGRFVALKFLRRTDDPGKHDEDVRRFLREASTAGRLKHPNIVAVYETGEGRGTHYIVMEYVDGRPLNQVRLPARKAMEVMVEVARAVHAAHETGVVHRDLKPSNIMLTSEGKAVVMDFGLARSVEGDASLTRTGFVMGTPMYMAPEVALGARSRDERKCDLYSLGATLYDLLTGRPPFNADRAWDVLAEVIHKEPIAPRQRDPKIPRDAETITLKAMQKRPENRYASAGEMAEDIVRFLRREPIHARPAPWHEKAVAWFRRNRAMALSVTGGLVLAAVLTSVLTVWGIRRAERLQRQQAAATLEPVRELLLQNQAAVPGIRETLNELAAVPLDADETVSLKLEERVKVILGEVDERLYRGLQAANQAMLTPGFQDEARRLVADLVWERFALAEEVVEENLALCENLVRVHGGPRYLAELDRPAVVSLVSDPAGAEVERFRYEDKEGRLVLGAGEKLGRTPLKDVAMARGSWLFILRHADRRDTRLPFLARRGGREDLKVRMFSDSEIGEGFIHVPAGKFIMGGDKAAMRPLPRREVHVGDFFISRTEVTAGEYLEFVNSIADADEREMHLPLGHDGGMLYLKDGERMMCPPSQADFPVMGVSMTSAQAYCRWRAARDGVRARLPTPFEWEKSARGVDGRIFPWGSGFRWEWTVGGRRPDGSHAAWLARAGSTESDESPYAVRDLAGNVWEWCEAGLGATSAREIRGGAGHNDGVWLFRSTSRRSVPVDSRVQFLGFRVVALPGE